MERTLHGRGVSKATDALWSVIALVVLAGAVASLITSLRANDGFGVFDLIFIAVGAVPLYWIGVGAWRRTSWSQEAHGYLEPKGDRQDAGSG